MRGDRDNLGRFIKGHAQLLSKRQLLENSVHVSGYWKGKKRPDMIGNSFGVGFADKSSHWKGEKVGYSGLHMYVRKHFGTPSFCELCGTKAKRKYHWARKTRAYSRKRKDWMRVCVPCHKRHDLENHD